MRRGLFILGALLMSSLAYGQDMAIPICDLFKDLPKWRGQRIAVRGEAVHRLFDGSEMLGDCEGPDVNGSRWPVSLSFGEAPGVRWPSGPAENEDSLRGRRKIVTETWVGRLRIADDFELTCSSQGYYEPNGLGALRGSPAELLMESVRDREYAPERILDLSERDAESGRCTPPNQAELCAQAKSLQDAVTNGCRELVSTILTKDGIDARDGGESEALEAAIDREDEAMVQLLLDHGAPVNPKQTSGFAPLGHAVMLPNSRIIKLLLKAGAEIDAKDWLGTTALFSPLCSSLLLKAGANPDVSDKKGRTPLMNFSEWGFAQEVRALLEHGASVNLRDQDGRTALMYAAAGEFVDAIPLLLEHRADVRARDAKGKTALDIAKESGREVAVELLAAAMNAR